MKTKKQKAPIVITGTDIIDAYPCSGYGGNFAGYLLVLKNHQEVKYSMRVDSELVQKIILKHFQKRKKISAIPKIKNAYVEG